MRSDRRGARPPAISGRLVALGLLALLASCSPRTHDNLFDPGNPDSRGRPDILTAAAGDGEVRLAWSSGGYADLRKIRLVRRDESGREIALVDSLLAGASAFADTNVANDSTYSYRLQFLFDGEPSPFDSREAEATPGRRVIWVLDQRTGGPVLVTPDARRQAAAPGSGTPNDLDVHPLTGTVVSADYYGRQVELFDRRGSLLARRGLDASPLSITMAGDSTVWVGCYDPSRLVHLTASLLTVIEADTGVGIPDDLAWDSARGNLWAADSDTGRLLHRWPSGVFTALGGFERPFSVAVDPTSGDAWLVDRLRGAVYRVDARGDTVVASCSAFEAPYTVVADSATGGAWVTDSAAGRIQHLAADGSVVGAIQGLSTPAGLALDPLTGDLWVTDAATDELIRVTPDGSVVARLGGFDSPFAVVVAVPPAR